MAYDPLITYSVVDTNATTKALTGDENVLVRHFSNAKAELWAQAQGGASINEDMYIIRNGSETGYGTEYTFYNVSSDTFTFSAEDSEGRISQALYKPTMIDYIKLTCNAVDSRPDASGQITLTCYGDYFNGSFGAKSNRLNVLYRYRLRGGTWGSYATMTVDLSGDSYYAYASVTGLDYQSTYDFEFNAIDQLMDVTASMSKVKSVPVFHWGENDVVFEVPVTFNKDSQVKGNLRLKGDGNYGNYLRFGDGDYCYLAELTDDKLTIKATTINLDTSNLTLKDKTLAEYDTWTPEFDYGGFTYYSCSGWYSKIGNVVTVGFYIKAHSPSGLEDAAITICDLPYTPTIAAAGGGMLSNGLMSTASDKNFQCFVAETDGTITTRAQDCDSTAGTEVATSASGFRYPSDTTLTLSGTITYMTN